MLPHTQFILNLLLDAELELSTAGACDFPYVILSKTYSGLHKENRMPPPLRALTLHLEGV